MRSPSSNSSTKLLLLGRPRLSIPRLLYSADSSEIDSIDSKLCSGEESRVVWSDEEGVDDVDAKLHSFGSGSGVDFVESKLVLSDGCNESGHAGTGGTWYGPSLRHVIESSASVYSSGKPAMRSFLRVPWRVQKAP